MEKGFTLIELIISIFIISVALIGIYSAFSIVVILTSDTADRLTAAYLAQEGQEIVRNIRDTNWLTMDTCFLATSDPLCASWVDGLAPAAVNNPIDCAIATAGCVADYTSTRMSSYTSGSYLHLDDTNSFYNSTSGATVTKFERKIFITPIIDINGTVADHIIKVTVQVSWDKKATILSSGVSAGNCITSGSVSNCVTAEEVLYDWYNYSPPVTTP
jgi:prepilin-type N-terminal cleavage/methylation domain-containing protein